MRDLVVLVLAASIASYVVWRVTAGDAPRGGHDPRRVPRVRFEDAVELTGGSPRTEAATGAPLVFGTTEAFDEPAHRTRSIIGLVVVVALTAAAASGALILLGRMAFRAIGNYVDS